MKALIVKIKNSKYLINIDNIDRIIQDQETRAIPNSEKYIEGVIDYINEALKVANLRMLLGLNSLKDEKLEELEEIKSTHIDWVEAIKKSVVEETKFTRSLNPHKCELGMKIDSLLSCLKCGNEFKNDLETNLKKHHDNFHETLKEIIDEKNKQKALDLIENKLKNIMFKVLSGIDDLKKYISLITSSEERIIIFNQNNKHIGLLVDSIDKIVEFDEKKLTSVKSSDIINKNIAIDKSIIIEKEILLFIEFKESFLNL